MAKILVIDDSKFSRKIAAVALRRGRHEVSEAEDGQKGLDAVDALNPDCVICDLLMPNLNGIGFLERLRGGGSSLSVIIASADVQASSRVRCEELGISAFLNKPYEGADLARAVEQALLGGESI